MVFCFFFSSVFTGNTNPQESLVQETRWKIWSKELPLVEEDYQRESLNKLNISMGPDWMHPQVLTEVDDVIVRPQLLIFERL